MPGRSYADFDLRIERSGDGYRSWAQSSLTGEASAEFRLTLSEAEIARFPPRFARPRRGRNLRRPSGKTPDLRPFGHQLFGSLFRDDVEICLRESLVQAAAQNLGLRLRLRLNGVPELARLPWEYLCDPKGDFLALSANTPVVRYPKLARSWPPLIAASPLRVLVLIARPSGLPPLNGDEEMRHIQKALQGLVERGLVVLDRVVPATFPELLARLRRERCHILHFIGHGAFEPERGEGVLALEDEHGQEARIDGRDLGAVLHRRKISLVVLNTCEGARHDESDALVGVAQALIRREIPAVVAMQSVVSDGAAMTFAQHFYQVLAEGFPVDGGLSEARLAMLAAGHATEWGTPVLYMRSSDG
ncbi:MAG TPA: CHAT domain-containing protein [Thermoanaerobaculia bacterium]|jgi:hypothetical protein|nr:CHAT domain-containing protein [Thermoanaerobaculia bacterium]